MYPSQPLCHRSLVTVSAAVEKAAFRITMSCNRLQLREALTMRLYDSPLSFLGPRCSAHSSSNQDSDHAVLTPQSCVYTALVEYDNGRDPC